MDTITEILYFKIYPFSILLYIAYKLGKIGSKKNIGNDWVFAFSIIMPLVGLIAVLLSKKKDFKLKKTPIILKIVGIILILYGSTIFLNGIGNGLETIYNPSYEPLIDPSLSRSEIIINGFRDAIALVLGGGFMTLFFNPFNEDYSQTAVPLMVGLLHILFGIYLMKNKKRSIEESIKILDEVLLPTEIEITKHAGLIARFAAFLIDAIIMGMVVSIIWYFFGLTIPENSKEIPYMGLVIFSHPITILTTYLYHAIMESTALQGSVGKMLVGLKVTDMEGQRISFQRATGRHWGKIVSTAFFFFGFVAIAWRKRKQGFHDEMAECYVLINAPVEDQNDFQKILFRLF